MPTPSAEKVQQRVASLKKKIAGAGDTMEPAARRKARKELKRAQRKQRRLTVVAQRRAGKPAEEASA